MRTMRARYPDVEGVVERDGVRVAYESFGEGTPAVVFTPPNAIIHGRAFKAQVPYLARNHRVVTIDPRGNGRSDRPTDPAAYADLEYVADTIAVLDAAGVDAAVLVGACFGAWRSLLAAARHPDRVLGVVALGPMVPFLAPPHPRPSFTDVLDSDEGWTKANKHYWLRDYRGFLEFFFGELACEPHSTKLVEDAVGFGLDTTAETLLTSLGGPLCVATREESEAVLADVRCPVLVVHGSRDACQPPATAVVLAELTGGPRLEIEGGGHVPHARNPVRVNLAIGEFLDRIGPPRHRTVRWARPLNRRRRVLFLSSPIGLGHARRDLAIARELRALQPDLEIDWLTQHPVTELLAREGERVHPASGCLASESEHLESEAGEHDLRVFDALRRMDEILLANFHVFHDLVSETDYDLWVGDEAWELDHFLHENPELKRSAYAWLTDFDGYLPTPEGGDREAALTADYNAERVEQVTRRPRLRDRAVFVGNADDVVPDPLGPGLPTVAEWTRARYAFAGYVTGFAPPNDRAGLRAELGYRPDERVCVVTVGGSGVGGHLLRRAVHAVPELARRVPGLRTVVVTGPRIDPASLPVPDGVEVHGYVPDLHRHLAACDVAVVQGGLTTTMELTTAARPFIYVPVGNHFEQNIHVRHRLARHRAGRCLDYNNTEPDALAAAIAEEIGREVDYLPVPADGAARAAALLADLI